MHRIHKRFGATIALDNVSISIEPGEVHALVGENGAGKSTLMKILSGAYRADSGEMLLDGGSFKPNHALDARHQGVGMIYQELSLAPHLTVEENIVLGMEPVRWGFLQRDDIRERAQKAISHFDDQNLRPDVRVRDLPIGARQLVEIGRSLAVGCRVLVFDEPTSSLSRWDIERLFEIINDLKKKNISIFYISHFLEEVQEIADRLTILRDGKAVATHTVEEISREKIVHLMVGREIKDLYPRSSRKHGKKLLEVRNLAGEKKPESASLVLHEGEVLGICGLVGAGRTEMLRAIFGLDRVRMGEIKVGVYAGPASPMNRWAQGVGILSENRNEEGLAINLSLADNVTLSKLEGFGPWKIVLPGRMQKATKGWVDTLDIKCTSTTQMISELSGGNQQKAAIARLLQHDVDVLLLDEPTRGIDVAAKAKIYQVIDEISTSSKERPAKGVLMISSYFPELLGICDRIAVMHRGRLGAAREADELDEHELMMVATGGVDD